ncbi:TatD family hydrolase [Gracilibacillus timonensis]|uniref:TatD family hydrolase n=1 Tax=Gracilibacillus timonensis TaxID=1816696 RepID=UPI0008271BCA|nr:TatD family hydrolase [Gracilibacillus timonensis]
MIDAHIHLDWYKEEERRRLLDSLTVDGMIAVSHNFQSCKDVWQLAQQYDVVHPAFGWHPEQPLPNKDELQNIMHWIDQHYRDMVAVGEVGLPYYTRQENPQLDLQPYQAILEAFMEKASTYQLPIVLHAVYEDADVVCDLLAKHQIKKAHFHWFKGSEATIERMIEQKYRISITPDCCYEQEIQELVKRYPLALMMAETDGPWSFEGPFQDQMTHPNMIEAVIKQIATLKQLPWEEVSEQLTRNTVEFYQL